MQLRMDGKGHAGKGEGLPGDLFILIQEESHPQLHREGNNLIYELYISFPEAVLGTSVEIPTIDGKEKQKIPPGTYPGKLIKLRGKGIPDVNGYGVGDLLIHVNVWIPQQITEEERKLLEKLQRSENFRPQQKKKGKTFFERVKQFFKGER